MVFPNSVHHVSKQFVFFMLTFFATEKGRMFLTKARTGMAGSSWGHLFHGHLGWPTSHGMAGRRLWRFGVGVDVFGKWTKIKQMDEEFPILLYNDD